MVKNRQTERLRLTYNHSSEGPENPWEEIPSSKGAFILPIDYTLQSAHGGTRKVLLSNEARFSEACFSTSVLGTRP